MPSQKIALWVGIGAAAATVAAVVALRLERWRPRTITIQGAVVRRDTDARKRVPIAGALISISDSKSQVTTISSLTGYFEVRFHESFWPQEIVDIVVRHPDYKPLDEQLVLGVHNNINKMVIARMSSTVPPPRPVAHPVPVSDIRIRYTVNRKTEQNIGSAIKVFEVNGQGGVPCTGNDLCSPGGLWKATKKTITMNAGHGDVFRNVRVSCIAGPCPFTKIDRRGFKNGGNSITVTAFDWSDKATFLVESEVFHTSIESTIRRSYPVIYGRDLHFTAPPTAEGVSIIADVDGTRTVFPLGPDLYMAWGICGSRKGANNDTIYECELKPHYRFPTPNLPLPGGQQ